MDGPSPLDSNGLPFQFTNFTGRDSGPKVLALPLNLDVVTFPTIPNG